MTPSKLRSPASAANADEAGIKKGQGKNTKLREAVAMVAVSVLWVVLFLNSTLGMLDAQRTAALRMSRVASIQAGVSHVE